MLRPKDALVNGVQILEPLLLPNGFHFRFGGDGVGSGGNFAWGEFVREERRLELHFRRSLGLDRYHVGEQSASHESYMRELGVWDQCRYPGFSDDPVNTFDDLAHDLGFADDFLVGPGTTLRQAAAKEAVSTAARQADAMAGYVGDKGKVDQLRIRFREKRYGDVLRLAAELKYPNRMSESERLMVEIARKNEPRVTLRLITPLRLGLLGISFYIGAVAWVAISRYFAQRNAPPGWILDRASPVGTLYLAVLGACLAVCALVWAAVAWIKRRVSS
ncbi:MAG: hypothetical protein WAN23_11620 [Candidatus Acidiferrales bacterium]